MQTFSDRVIKIALQIPEGRVTTYGRIARAAGAGPMASQSITAILGKAYQAGIKNIPFHRIVYADGRAWLSNEYEKKRLALYKKEGIQLDKNGKPAGFGNWVEVACIDGTRRRYAHLKERDVKVGDVVLFAKYSGTEVKIEGKKLLIMRESDLLGIVG